MKKHILLLGSLLWLTLTTAIFADNQTETNETESQQEPTGEKVSNQTFDKWLNNYFTAYTRNDARSVRLYRDSIEQNATHFDELATAKLGIIKGHPEEVFESLRTLSSKGNPEAMLYFGQMHLGEKAIVSNPKNGFKWIKRSADKDYIPAQRYLWKCYLYGIGTSKNNKQAIKILKKLAIEQSQQSALEQEVLGTLYFYGIGITKNVKEALKWLEMAANNGRTDSQLILGAYYYGDEKSHFRDARKSFDYFKMAADKGITRALIIIGAFYQTGVGTPKDIQAAISYYSLAAEAGDFASQINLGDIFYAGKEVQKNNFDALKWYRMAAANNSTEEDNPEKLKAQYRVATINLNAPMKYRNYGEAFHWLQKLATENNYTQAYADYAYCQQWGYGTEKNIGKAIEWYQKVANDNAYAMEQLGRIYCFSPPPFRNPPLGNKWFEKASMQGRNSSTRFLATNYLSGNGIEKNPQKGFEMLLALAEKEYYPAYFYLGQAYLNGRGTLRNVKQAVLYLEKGIEKGDAACMHLMGLIHFNPTASEYYNIKKAIDYFEMSCLKGNSNSMYTLGRIYTSGGRVPKEPVKGVEWLKKAAQKGHKLAISDLGVAYLRGIGLKQNVDSARYWFESIKTEELTTAGLYHKGTMIEAGKGYPKSPETALMLYKEAAAKKFPLAEQKVRLHEIQNKGDDAWQTLPLKDVYAEASVMVNSKAQYELHRRYSKGVMGVEKSPKYARMWLERAARNGHPKAKKEIGNTGYQFKLN